MSYITARSNCPSRSRPPVRTRNSGYALITLMIMVAVLLISLTAALPSLYQAGQREREEEAIFCGNQYARAVYLFYRKFGRYPTSVKDLLNTTGIRFLREPYRDPLSPDGKWRFIHAAAGGILIDSWNQTTIVPGAVARAASPAAGAAGSPGNQGNAASNNSQVAETAANGKPKHPPSTCSGKGGNSPDQSNDSSFQTGTLLGAFIVGVAPCNDGQSIRVLDHHGHYNHWEFVGLNYRAYGLPQSSPIGNSPQPSPSLMGASSQPGNPSGPAGPGTPGATTPQ